MSRGSQLGALVGLATLYVTTVVSPHPWGMHGGIWALMVNWLLAWSLTLVTAAPEPARVGRIHGALEEFVYGSPDER